MKIWKLWQVALVILGLAAFAAASPVNVTFNYGNGGPVNGTTNPANMNATYYPYYMTVNGTQITVACDDFADHVSGGETWQATINHFTTDTNGAVNGVTGGYYASQVNSPVNYEEAAYLFYQFQATPPTENDVNAAINYAIWDIFDSSAPTLLNVNHNNGDPMPANTASAYWLAQAASNYGSLTANQISAFEIFTPNVPGDRPQEMLGSAVPEPASLALLGTGLLGLAFLFKRRLHEGVSLDIQA